MCHVRLDRNHEVDTAASWVGGACQISLTRLSRIQGNFVDEWMSIPLKRATTGRDGNPQDVFCRLINQPDSQSSRGEWFAFVKVVKSSGEPIVFFSLN